MTIHTFSREESRIHLSEIFEKLSDESYIRLTFPCLIRSALVLLQDEATLRLAQNNYSAIRDIPIPDAFLYPDGAAFLGDALSHASAGAIRRYAGEATVNADGSIAFGHPKSAPILQAQIHMAERLQQLLAPALKAA